MKTSAISRRVEKGLKALIEKDYEEALLNIFPALDKTAKKRRPQVGVGERIREFIRDEGKYITGLMTSSAIGNFKANGYEMPQVIYKFARNSLLHEGEIDDSKLTINEEGYIRFGPGVWSIPDYYIKGLLVVIILAPENRNTFGCNKYEMVLMKRKYKLGTLWGRKDIFKVKLLEKWPNGEF